MGGCWSRNEETISINDHSRPSSGPASSTNIGSQRKNHPLFHETIRWKSDVPLTEGQLRSKRDEFWETAPAFEGRKEIWDALRAAVLAAESLDFQLAQAILDGANIFLANGYLTECYDELGSHYKIPIYCLSHPVNIVKEDHDSSESPAEYSEPVDGGNEVQLKLRLSSTLTDVKLSVFSKDSIFACKKKLQTQEKVDVFCQRWFYGGKLLGDKTTIEEAKIQPGYIVQVIINTEKLNAS